jgi:bifunctional non-homologous end joining protein LigD
VATEQLTEGRITVGLSKTGKVLFPEDGITKGDLVQYYHRVAGHMLPWLRDRPISMVRYPDGINGEGIMQKNAPRYFPDWVTRAEVGKQGGTLRHVICDKPATLVYLANQACIELHSFLSKLASLDAPDQMIFDLDPPDASRFGEVRQVALRLRQLLEEELGLTSFVKTTGGKGLHVHVPLNTRAGFDEVREFARQVCDVLVAAVPDLLTIEQRKENRGGRIYADIMRNAYAQLAIAPYSVRARPGAPVATPLSWDELEDAKLSPAQLTIRTVPGRLAATGGQDDPWAAMARRRHGLAQARRRLRGLGR